MQTVAQRLQLLRAKLRWNQQELAARLGVSRNYVSMIEQGREPSKSLILLLEQLEREAADDPVRIMDQGADYGSRSPIETMRVARQSKGLSFADLAKLTKYKADVLQAVEEGNGKASEKMIEAICAALQLSKADLLSGQIPEANGASGTYGAKPNVVAGPGVGTPRYVPLISMATAGTMGASSFTDGGYDYEGTLAFDVKDNRAFGVKITGDSMAPVFAPGDIAIVYPSSAPRSGDHVIARLSDHAGGGVLFKIYTPRDGGDRIVLSSYNPAHPPAELKREDLIWIYPVQSVMKNLRNH